MNHRLAHTTVWLLTATLSACGETGLTPADEPGLIVRVLGFAQADPISSAVIRIDSAGQSLQKDTRMPGDTFRSRDLRPGQYVVSLEGFRADSVIWFDTTVVDLGAGERKEARLTARSFVPVIRAIPVEALPSEQFMVQWDPVPGAAMYRLELRQVSAPSPAPQPIAFADSTPGTSLPVRLALTGDFHVYVRARNRYGSMSAVSTGPPSAINIVSPLSINDQQLSLGIVGRPYSTSLLKTGGGQTTTWSVVGGSLPAGLTLSSNGVVSGTPAAAQTSSFSVRAVSHGNLTASRTLSITTHSALALAITPPSARIGWIGAGIVPKGIRIGADGNTVNPSPSLQWTSDNPAIATVNPTSGEIVGRARGQTTIRAQDLGTSPRLSASVQVQVSTELDANSIYRPNTRPTLLTTNALTWQEAQDAARLLGGRLVVIETDLENTNLWQRYGTTGSLWIGLSDQAVEGTYKWTNGSPETTSPWAPIEPSRGPTEDCVAFVVGAQGRWGDEDCATRRRAIIEFEIAFPIEFARAFALSGVPFAKTADETDWATARDLSVALGGGLTVINSLSENRDIVEGAGGEGPWIGLNDLEVEGQFKWATGEPVTFTNWAPTEPNNDPDEDCVHLSNFHGNGYWNDIECYVVAPDGPRAALIRFPRVSP